MNICNRRWLSVFTLLICGSNKQTFKLLFLATITSIGLNIVPASAATSGTWVGEAEFGTFALVVNAQGTGIEQIDYDFSAFTCGPDTFSNTIFSKRGGGWPISNGEFSITNTLPLSTEMTITISGAFESTTQAAGTWNAEVLGEQCTGTWETLGGGSATGGTWVGEAEFGTFDLEVNVQGVGVEEVAYYFSAFTCGPVTLNTRFGFKHFVYWPISNGEFSITVIFSGDSYLTVSGTFESATLAAGTWEAGFSGEQCTGTWEATIDDPEAFTINAGLNDAWYYPETDGQGFFITVFPDLGVVSLAWFTYATELPAEDAVANLGDPGHRWITAIGPIVGNQVMMDIEMTSGGLFDTDKKITRTDPPGSDGTILLTFDSCNSGTIEYDIPSVNRRGTVPIQRVANDNIVICEALSAD